MTRTVKKGSSASSGAASHAESSNASARNSGRNKERRQEETLRDMGKSPFQNFFERHYSTVQERCASVRKKRNAKKFAHGRKKPGVYAPGKRTGANYPRAAAT